MEHFAAAREFGVLTLQLLVVLGDVPPGLRCRAAALCRVDRSLGPL